MHVLVPMDYSELSERALETTCSLHPDAEVTVLHVIDFRTSDLGPGGWGESPTTWDDWLAESHEHADRLFERARAIAADHDVDIDTATAVGEDARSIVEYAEEHDVDLIIMGSHGRSLPARILLGGVSESVVRRAPCPVMVVR
ncbi:universal stress protein [Halorarius halobius]|uniref:universal stress protein n=1 Tax=Halorarius halobius TaxID=2962671 RepID=UPI0020CC2DE4|nr:universal stress protein [Halorarius halobius]